MADRVALQVVQHLLPGGLETLALDLAVFARPGWQIHIAAIEGDSETSFSTWPELRPFSHQLHFLNKGAGVRPSAIAGLCRLIRATNAVAVHTHHLGPLLYGGAAARLCGIGRLIHTEHNAWHLQDRRHRFLQHWAFRLLRPVIVADAEVVAQNLSAAIPGFDNTVILNGIDLARYCPGGKNAARRELGLPRAFPLIGCAARLEEVKGHRYLIEALQALPENVHLALAGDGSLRGPLKKLAEALKVDAQVHFLGRVQRMEVFYRALDLFCLPSLNEGLPLALLESQACGIPSVVSDVGACAEVVCPLTGEAVPPGDSGKLALALARQLASPNRRSPRDHVAGIGDVHQMSARYTQLYAA